MRRALVVAILVAGFAGYSFLHAKPGQRSFETACAYVDSQLAAHRCTSREVAARQIGWVYDLKTAFMLARSTRRPVFVLDGDGDVCTGRL